MIVWAYKLIIKIHIWITMVTATRTDWKVFVTKTQLLIYCGGLGSRPHTFCKSLLGYCLAYLLLLILAYLWAQRQFITFLRGLNKHSDHNYKKRSHNSIWFLQLLTQMNWYPEDFLILIICFGWRRLLLYLVKIHFYNPIPTLEGTGRTTDMVADLYEVLSRISTGHCSL